MKSHGKSKAVLTAVIFEVNLLQSSRFGDALRVKREEICFAIVNRGQVWYESLTAVQRAELLLWYNAWLNVTETLTIPDTPCWIK